MHATWYSFAIISGNPAVNEVPTGEKMRGFISRLWLTASWVVALVTYIISAIYIGSTNTYLSDEKKSLAVACYIILLLACLFLAALWNASEEEEGVFGWTQKLAQGEANALQTLALPLALVAAPPLVFAGACVVIILGVLYAMWLVVRWTTTGRSVWSYGLSWR